MKKLLTLLITLPLFTSCSLDWLTGEGHYGPFEMVIKAKDGEHVDDIIVLLAKVVPAGMEGLGHTYNAIAVTSTDVPVTFPRGYVSRDKFETLSLDMEVLHPYYGLYKYNATFPRRTEGKIDLGEQFIVSRENRDWLREDLFKQGLSQEEVEKEVAQVALSAEQLLRLAVRDYFLYAHSIGRDDLIKKYFRLMVARVFVEKGIKDPTEQRRLQTQYRNELTQWVKEPSLEP